MRVISGFFKGRRLVSFRGDHIRPTTDFVKEGIFNRLASEIPESRVLDLFSGTGNLSIEALSRGASEVVALEKNPGSLKVIMQNLKHLQIVPTLLQGELVTQERELAEEFSGGGFEEKGRRSVSQVAPIPEKRNCGKVTIIKDDVISFLKDYQGESFDIILIDPPFTQKIAHRVMGSVIESHVTREETCIVIESGGSERLDKSYGEFELSAQKDYGDKKLSFFRQT